MRCRVFLFVPLNYSSLDGMLKYVLHSQGLSGNPAYLIPLAGFSERHPTCHLSPVEACQKHPCIPHISR